MKAMLPGIPEGSTFVNDVVGIQREDGIWTYYVYLWPICSHSEGTQNQFCLIAAMLIESGLCRPCHIVKAFGVNRKMP